jgi:hypothetical protein
MLLLLHVVSTLRMQTLIGPHEQSTAQAASCMAHFARTHEVQADCVVASAPTGIVEEASHIWALPASPSIVPPPLVSAVTSVLESAPVAGALSEELH